MKRFPRDRAQLAFIDLLFILLLLFVLIINPPTKESAARPMADFMLFIVWDAGRNTDLDVYVRGPDRAVAWFRTKDIGYASIDRDDLGATRDYSTLNQEIVGFRSPPDGSYLVSLHTYRESAPGPGTVLMALQTRAGQDVWGVEIPLPGPLVEVGVVEFVFREGAFVRALPSSALIRHAATGVRP